MPTTTTRLRLQEWPDATNTGVPPGTSLTTHNGNMFINTANQVIEDLHFVDGTIVLQGSATNTLIRRCLIDSGPSNFAGVLTESPFTASGTIIEDCEFDGGNVDGSTAIASVNFTVRRCNIHNYENGFDVGAGGAANLDVRDCWLHDMVPYTVELDPHIDAVQGNPLASNVVFHHNNFDVGNDASSAFSIHTGVGGCSSNWWVTYNKLNGGAITMRCPTENCSGSNIYINHNRFGRDFFFSVDDPATRGNVTEFIGNVYDDDGTPI